MINDIPQAPTLELDSTAQQNGNDENKAWPAHIDVYLEDDSGPKPTFHIESSLPSYKNAKGEEILKFENRHRPGFKLHFHLHDGTGKGYEFPNDPEDAIWSQAGSNCPQSKVNNVFTPLRVVDRGPFEVPMLVVYLENEKVDGAPIGLFKYSLNVVKVAGQQPLCLDPGGDAGNGPRRFLR